MAPTATTTTPTGAPAAPGHLPTLVLWATGDDLGDLYGDVLAVWHPWAADLRGHPFPSGHHMAEEAPDALAAELLAFLAAA